MTARDSANATLNAKRALVVGDEAEQHDLVALARHALEDERLVELLVDLSEHRRHLGEGHDDLGRDDRGADPLQAHGRETLLPLVLGGLGTEVGATVLARDRRKRGIDGAGTRGRVRDHGEVRRGELGLVVLVRLLLRMTVAVRQLLLQPRRLGVEERDRPYRHALRADVEQRVAQGGGVGESDEPMHLVLERPNAEGDLGDDAGDPLGVGDVGGKLVAGELADLTGGKDHTRRDDVVLELAVLEAAEARSALGQPSRHARAGIGRGVHPQRRAPAC